MLSDSKPLFSVGCGEIGTLRYTGCLIFFLIFLLPVSHAAAVPAPSDWAESVRAGNMLFWGGALPVAGHMPSVGNGYLAKEVGPWHSVGAMNDFGSFYLAGVFNGVGNVTPSHRAAIPDAGDVRLRTGEPLGAALDLRGGAFLNRTLVHESACDNVQIQQRTYAIVQSGHSLLSSCARAQPVVVCGLLLAAH